MKVQLVDPAAYTPPYDHALAAALAAEGVDVELVTSRFGYSEVPQGEYRRSELFYRHSFGAPGSRLRTLSRLGWHLPEMLRYRRYSRSADLVHFQWLPLQQLDRYLLPSGRPLVVTAHDVLPREAAAGQRRAQRAIYDRADAVIAHSQHSQQRLTQELGVEAAKVRVIPHGVFDHLTQQPDRASLPAGWERVDRPVVLCFGLMRPYKGIDQLLEAWGRVEGAELWIVGLPKMDITQLQAASPDTVRWLPRFIHDDEIPAFFKRADLVVLPYRQIEQSGVLYTALAFGKPLLLTAVGGFPEVAAEGAAELVAANDPAQLAAAIGQLLADPAARSRLSARALELSQERYSWRSIAQQTLALYRELL